jgi:RNase P subunit RPR2
VPRKGRPRECPKCHTYGKLNFTIVRPESGAEIYIAVWCMKCSHRFKSYSKIARGQIYSAELREKNKKED